ncbi:MAG: hypothetical protein ACPGVG_14415 [Mycobacterium sp.]
MSDPTVVTISIGGMADYVTASSSQKLSVVIGLVDMYGTPYNRGRDFYRGVRKAIDDGLVLGQDVRRVREALDTCLPGQRKSYEAVADGWQTWRGRKDLQRYAETTYRHEQGLKVRVSPRFVHRQLRRRDLIWPYFKGAELSRDGAQTAIRLMELACPADAGTAAVLDVRRGQLHRPRRRDRDYDTWLRSEVTGMLRMYETLARAA